MRTTDGYGLAQVSGSGQQGFNQSSQRGSDWIDRAVCMTHFARSILTSVKATGFSPIAFGNQTIFTASALKNTGYALCGDSRLCAPTSR